ncbi:MAG: aminotransferase class V-fold PLP-dependent enzyme [Clostridiaceae bacterium]
MQTLDITKIREDFPALNEFIYLNSSSISLIPMPVQKKLSTFSEKINYAGTVSFDEEAEIGSVEGARMAVAQLLNCSQDNIAIITSATEGLCQVAWGLQPKGKILTVDIEFPSDALAWARVARQTGARLEFIRAKDRPADLTTEDIISAIDDDTSVVAISHAQYSNGLVVDIEAIAQACHEKNAVCVVDAVQSVGIVPIDLSNSQVDVLVAGGYKWLCGPFGAAAMFINDRIKDRLEPTFVGWRSMKDPYFFDATRYEYNTGLRAFEFSTMSYAAGYAFGESVKYINNLGIVNIQRQAQKVAGYLMDNLDGLGAQVLSPRENHRRTGAVFARFPGLDGEKVAARLNSKGVIVSPRFNGTRFSCHFFNNEEDIDRAIKVLKIVLEEMRRIG